MNAENKIKIVLLTGLNNNFTAELAKRIKNITEASFEDVIFWRAEGSPWAKFRKNIKKHGAIYLPFRIIRWVNNIFIKKIYELIESVLLFPKIERTLITICSGLKLNLHNVKDIHSNAGIEFIKSLNPDLMVVCGSGILRKSVFTIPHIGTINLHQGEVPRYRGAPPGFWELWNNEKQAGVTIHFIDEGVDTGEVILKELVPIFEYDTLISLQKKLAEVSLKLYSEAIKLVACGTNQSIPQPKNIGKQYYFPTLYQRLSLFLKLKRSQFQLYAFIKDLAKKVIFLFGLTAIYIRDFYLQLKGKNMLSVLYYHRVTDLCQDGMTVSVEEFERQIRFLRKWYHIISANEISDWLNVEGGTKGKKAILITFDDGYEDNYTNVLPILKQYSCPAIFFVSTGLIGNDLQFQHDREIQPQLTFRKMTWEQLSDALFNNVMVGVHTDTHANLGKIPLNEATIEIETSIIKYKEHLRKYPSLMSYPFGGKKDITEDVVSYLKNKRHITTLFSAYGNKNISPINRYNIKRINIGSKDRKLVYWFKIEGGIKTLIKPYED
jgi:peptidoglycan/xylan/chitin deacetylase (PgdA/CDA1 family)/folate-dependent phosphoribosylglycinamide formyltransferase PurN